MKLIGLIIVYVSMMSMVLGFYDSALLFNDIRINTLATLVCVIFGIALMFRK